MGGVCVHKQFLPVQPSEIVGYVVLPMLLVVSIVGGAGGGTVFIPLAMACFKFNSKEAVAMSIGIVCTTSMIRTLLFSLWEKHPLKPNATEIDFNTVRMTYPMFLVGSYCGVITSIALPELILSLTLTVLLFVLAVMSFQKGKAMWAKESISSTKLDEYNTPFFGSTDSIELKTKEENSTDQ
jgi:uncharacterized membrane protein YfcA